MRPIVTDRLVWSVCLSIGMSVTVVGSAKADEPIEMPFGLWARVGPRNHVLDEGADAPTARGTLGECMAHCKA